MRNPRSAQKLVGACAHEQARAHTIKLSKKPAGTAQIKHDGGESCSQFFRTQSARSHDDSWKRLSAYPREALHGVGVGAGSRQMAQIEISPLRVVFLPNDSVHLTESSWLPLTARAVGGWTSHFPALQSPNLFPPLSGLPGL